MSIKFKLSTEGQSLPLDAEMEARLQGLNLAIFVASRGAGRNNQYDAGVEAILERIDALGAQVICVAVERRHEKRDVMSRLVVYLSGWEYVKFYDVAGLPIPEQAIPAARLVGMAPRAKRLAIRRLVAGHGRPAGAKGGGNGQKAILITTDAKVSGDLAAFVTERLGGVAVR